MDDIDRLLDVFLSRDIVAAANVISYLKQNDISWTNFLLMKTEHVERERARIQGEIKRSGIQTQIRCPVCNAPVQVIRIKTPKGKANKKGFRSLIQCSLCVYEVYSRKSPERRIKELVKKRRKYGNSK